MATAPATATSPVADTAARSAEPVTDPSALRSPAMHAAATLLDALVAQGVAHVVLSPGSRSQALALVAAELERRGRLSLHVRIDERVAGFTALGIGRETGVPAAVVCTSGTAVANLLPAVLEAHHAGVPLVLVTADRPPELRGVGANQTTRQPGMFTPNTRFEADLPVPEAEDETGESASSVMLCEIARDAVAAAVGHGARPAGPVHLNVPLREPLAGALPAWFAMRGQDTSPSAAAETEGEWTGALYQGGGGIGSADVGPIVPEQRVLERGPRTVVIAGADAGPAAEELAHRGGWPLIAEIVSGARYGRNIVHAYRAALGEADLGGSVERAVVFGHPTLTREVTALLSDPRIEVIAVRGPGEPLGLNGATVHVDAISVDAGAVDRGWLGAWQRHSHAATPDLDPPAPDRAALASSEPGRLRDALSAELAHVRRRVDRAGLVDAVWRATWPHDRLMFGSSRLVRVADAVLPGKKVPVHANRGLAGIDGTIATATGIALASQAGGSPGTTRVLLGDLAFLHDVGALLTAPGERRPRLQVIVGNDGGGTIFDGLEVADAASAADMTRVLFTPHDAQLADLAAAYGWEFVRAEDRAQLDQALLSAPAGPQIIEVPLER